MMQRLTRVGFTGTRDGMTTAQKREVERIFILLGPKLCELHHGDCVGADEQAHFLALELGFASIVIHPPEKDGFRADCFGRTPNESETKLLLLPPKNYFARNRDIAKASDVLVGTPHPLASPGNGGTWYTLEFARKHWELNFRPSGENGFSGFPIHVVFADGLVRML